MMKRSLEIAVFLAAVAMMSGAAQAQFRMRGPSFQGVWNPVVGSGATYDFDNGRGNKTTMEIAIVGKDTVEGKDAYWLETSFTPPSGQGEMVTKMLYYRDGDDIVVKRMIMQMPGRPPMEMPEQMLQRRAEHPQSADIRKDADDLGKDSVTTPAGVFDCEHYKMKDGSAEVWVKEKTGPYGLVKSSTKDGVTMVLTRVFADAKDKITGTPQPFNPMERGRPQQ